MRDRPPQERKSRKGGLSSDTAIIVALLHKQPQKKEQLIKNSHISPSSFSRDEPMLLDENVIKVIEGGYALWYFESQTTLLEKKFLELKQSNELTVGLGILANYVGKPPDIIKEEAYRLGNKHEIWVIE